MNLPARARRALATLLVWPLLAAAQPSTPLHYEVLVTDGAPRAGQHLPDGAPIVSSPVSSTLVWGEHDALLVDPPLTLAQTAQVVAWIEKSGKHLRYVYSTHGHADHWFGTAQVLARFPDAVAYATPGTIRLMERQGGPGRARYERDFPGQIGPSPVLAHPIPAEGLSLEGHAIVPVEVGHSDTDDTSVLHVPDLGLVVAGDVAYNGVHQYLLEGGHGGLERWLDAIARVEALHPRVVVAGHKQRARPDDPACLDDTRRYVQDALRLLAATPKPTPREFFDRMSALHPDRINPGPLWYSGVGLLQPTPAAPASAASS